MNLKIFNITSWLLALLLLASCKKWTDIKPSIEVRGELIFSNETTVQEALNGVYGRMTQTAGYGRNLTWGFVDIMGGLYNTARLQSFEADAAAGKFGNSSAESIIEQLWNNTYTAIANDNNLISNIDKADAAIFSGNNKNLIKGEALGLRAMLHFDLLRLFGPAVNSSGWNQPMLPYVTLYSSNVTTRSTGPDFLAKLQADLSQAEELLKEDKIRTSAVADELRARKVRFNYYAVKALQARVYLWAGDKVKAQEAAMVVINAAPSKFQWTGASGISSLGTFYDYILSSENIFSLYVNNLKDFIAGKLVNISTTGTVTQDLQPHYGITEAIRQEMYESGSVGVTDYRSIYMIGTETKGANTTVLYKKLHQSGGLTSSGEQKPFGYAENRIPMMKVAEMFYIAAECLADTDPAQAVSLLNTVRTNRGISSPLAASLNDTQIHPEIRKEYRKEFPCEGQFFYYRKRRGEVNYILPVPKRELEYGL